MIRVFVNKEGNLDKMNGKLLKFQIHAVTKFSKL